MAASSDPFLLRQSFTDLCWLNPEDNQPLYGNHSTETSLLLQPEDHNQSSFSPFSSSDIQLQTPSKRRIASVNKSRITKRRKSRATKKNQTTFITADPANFRQMVQQVTGIRLDTTSSSPLSQLLKPESHRPIGRLLYNAFQLPTLDTSSFLLEHNNHHQQQSQSGALVDGENGYGASDGFGIASFPTLESWKVM